MKDGERVVVCVLGGPTMCIRKCMSNANSRELQTK